MTMKKIVLSLCLLVASFLSFSQTSPSLLIDGKAIKFESDISLPYWLDAGKTVSLGANAASVSILEFTIDSNNLVYNKTIHLTSSSAVPNGKTWKIEAIGIDANPNRQSGFSTNVVPSLFSSPQTITDTKVWVVPPGVFSACFEIWGKGGGASFTYISGNYYMASGGGGGYGYECISVTPGDSIDIQFGDTIHVGNYFYATTGMIGSPSLFKGGDGGTSNAKYSIAGESGQYGGSPDGGAGANGGAGGSSGNGLDGQFPGGGAGAENSGRRGSPGLGQVKIYF